MGVYHPGRLLSPDSDFLRTSTKSSSPTRWRPSGASWLRQGCHGLIQFTLLHLDYHNHTSHRHTALSHRLCNDYTHHRIAYAYICFTGHVPYREPDLPHRTISSPCCRSRWALLYCRYCDSPDEDLHETTSTSQPRYHQNIIALLAAIEVARRDFMIWPPFLSQAPPSP